MRRITAVAMIGLVLASSLAMAGKAKGSQPYSQLAVVPDESKAQSNPLEGDPNATTAGRKLYERHCLECHGATAESGRKGPSLRATEVQSAPPGALFWVLTNGNVRAGMPVWSKLPEPQRWQIVSYLRSLGAVAPAARDSKAR